MKCIVLAAGYATRLYPLTKDTPKPLLDVGGKPMLEHILGKVNGIDAVDSVLIVTNAKFYSHFLKWKKQFRFPKPITLVNDLTDADERRRGSLGDIQFTIDQQHIDDDILVIAGDNLFSFSLKLFVEQHLKHRKSAVALFDVQDKELAKLYGIVGMDNHGKMVEFCEKPAEPASTLASTGIYIYPKEVFPLLKEFVTKFKNTDKAGHFLEYLHKKEEVYCFVTDEPWMDIGSIEQLEKARKTFKG